MQYKLQPLHGTDIIRLGEGGPTTVAMLSMALTIGTCYILSYKLLCLLDVKM